jgi:hypothetical protein
MQGVLDLGCHMPTALTPLRVYCSTHPSTLLMSTFAVSAWLLVPLQLQRTVKSCTAHHTCVKPVNCKKTSWHIHGAAVTGRRLNCSALLPADNIIIAAAANRCKLDLPTA